MVNRMRGLVPVATGLNGQGSVARVQASTGTGLSSAMAAISGEFADVGARIGQMADKAAASEGDLEGRFAGLDPEFRTRRDNTIRGNAFDRAGLQTAETRLRTSLEAGFEAAWQKHGQNPTKLNEAIAAQTQGLLSGAPQELRPELGLLAQRKGLGLMRQAQRDLVTRTRAEQAASLQEELQRSLSGVNQSAYALGIEQKADEALAGDKDALHKTLARTGIDGKPLVDRKQAVKLQAALLEDVTEARLLGAFERLPTTDAKRRFISAFEEDFAGSKGLAKNFDLDGFRRVGGILGSELRRAEAADDRALRVLGSEVKKIADMAEKGFAPKPDDLAGLKARIATSGSPDLEAMLAGAEGVLKWQQVARRSTPEELDAFALSERDRMRAGGARPEDVARVEVAEKLADEARRELKQDPLGWADRVGIADVPALDVENLPASVAARIATAETVAERYGIEPKFLRPDEARRLAATAAQGGDRLIGVAATIAETAGDKAPAIMAEIGKDAPTIAFLGGHIVQGGVAPAVRDAADGIALMRNDGFKSVAPPAKEARRLAVEEHAGALSGMPRAEAAAIAAANAAYEVRARRRGLVDFDADLWRQTFSEMLGAREIGGETYGGIAYSQMGWLGGGSGVVVVPPDVKQSGFRDLIETIRLEDLPSPPRYSDGKEASIADVRRASLVQAGNGQYMLNLGTEEDPRWLKGEGDDPYVLDIDALRPTLKKRRPDLYLGGR